MLTLPGTNRPAKRRTSPFFFSKRPSDTPRGGEEGAEEEVSCLGLELPGIHALPVRGERGKSEPRAASSGLRRSLFWRAGDKLLGTSDSKGNNANRRLALERKPRQD